MSLVIPCYFSHGVKRRFVSGKRNTTDHVHVEAEIGHQI